jgi:hypothetical protein
VLNGDIDRFLEAALASRITGADARSDTEPTTRPGNAAS